MHAAWSVQPLRRVNMFYFDKLTDFLETEVSKYFMYYFYVLMLFRTLTP